MIALKNPKYFIGDTVIAFNQQILIKRAEFRPDEDKWFYSGIGFKNPFNHSLEGVRGYGEDVIGTFSEDAVISKLK